jgi:hypothetical protein
MFELIDNVPQSAVIKVVGVGGGGGNAVKHMIDNHVDGVDFICANTDAQALSDVASKTVLQLGSEITKGLGAGANPDIGRAAAMEDRERIADSLRGAARAEPRGALASLLPGPHRTRCHAGERHRGGGSPRRSRPRPLRVQARPRRTPERAAFD